MSQEAYKLIIKKASVDDSFQQMLFIDPGKALAGYSLTDAERAALEGLDEERLKKLRVSLSRLHGDSVEGEGPDD